METENTPDPAQKWMKMHFMRYLQHFIDIECLQILIKFMLQYQCAYACGFPS